MVASTLPSWLRRPLPAAGEISSMKAVLRSSGLATVCESARCPNLGECFRNRTSTFMILGKICTRSCTFCGVSSGLPEAPDSGEPMRVASAAKALNLAHVVVTSVTRDDLPDGGAGSFAEVVREINAALPKATVEVLIPDFKGEESALSTVVSARPDVLNHNLETVSSLTRSIRSGAEYRRSLGVLSRARILGAKVTKTGIMVGLGETLGELYEFFGELCDTGVDILTIGQYLEPGPAKLPVQRYYEVDEFAELAEKARSAGIKQVFSGPFVRSSYHAGEILADLNCKHG
ncbi:MAG: lipoyl synthase [Planctomycetes bacterium]|nr:lipoyl synthase [Planctomycetota bacterium]